MRTLPIAFACCLGVVTTASAVTSTPVEPNSSTEISAAAPSATPNKGTLGKPTTYMHTDDTSTNTTKMSQMVMTSASAKTMGATDCLITIRNEGIYDMVVYGRFDDGTYLNTFTLPWFGSYVTYVDLYYYGYCHGGMDFYIDTTDGTYKYNGYTPVGKTIRVK